MKNIYLTFLLVLLGASLVNAGQNFITFQPDSGLVSSGDNIISVWLNNADSVRGVQFETTSLPYYLQPDSVWTTARAQGFVVNYYQEEDTLNIILISFSSFIKPDTGAILQIRFSVPDDAPKGQKVDLLMKNLVISNPVNEELEVEFKNGSFIIDDASGVSDVGQAVFSFSLEQNYPNPFNPGTRLNFTIPKSQHVLLEIYNSLGQRVRTLINSNLSSGNHYILWDGLAENGNGVPAGVYFYRIKSGEFISTKQMTLLR